MKFVRCAILTLTVLGCLAVPEPAEAGPLRRIGRAAGRVASAPFRLLRRAGARVRARRCG